MKALTVKTLSIVALCGLATVGCNNQDKKEEKSEEVAPAVTPISNLSCDDASIKNALVQELTGVVEKQIVEQLDDLDADKADLEAKAKSRLPEIAVDLQNVRNENGVCLTDLHITMPATDVGYANRHYKSTNEPSVGEQAESLGIKFNDNHFVSTISYGVDGGNVKLEGTPDILQVVAGATSVAAYMMTKDSVATPAARPNTSANNATNARPAAPAPAPVVRPRPPKPADTTHNPAPPKPKTTNNENASRSETSATPKAEPKSETPKTETPKAESPRAETPKATPKAEPKEAVKDTTSEITIVETDDTY